MSEVKIYCWQYVEFDDLLDATTLKEVNLSVENEQCDAFIEQVEKLVVGKSQYWNLSVLPNGSPHHLDNPKEVITSSSITFSELHLLIERENTPRNFIRIDEPEIFITLSEHGRKLFLDAVRLSKEYGYLFDNQIDVVFQFRNQVLADSKLNIWASYENHIIFY